MDRARDSSDSWVDLLLTDSLDRPLGDATYTLDVAGAVSIGRLSTEGRVTFELPEGGGALLLAHRTLRLVRGAQSGLERQRDRLTNLGYDAGDPTEPLDPTRVRTALRAFSRATGTSAGAAHETLDAWARGVEGLTKQQAGAPPLHPFRRGFFDRWRARRAAKLGPSIRAGSHLRVETEYGGRFGELAVATGSRGSPASFNRIALYDWFSGFGTPPRPGNVVEILIDGEEAFGRLADDIDAASSELCLTTWFADPDTELRRPLDLALANTDLRARNRMAARVEDFAGRGGAVSILVWNWVMTPIMNPTLRKWAIAIDDGIDILQARHPRLFGSFHQKTVVVDRAVGYCAGFNLRQNDWDTQEHRVDDTRRNPHGISGWERKTSEPEYPPRHDVGVRLEGPVVADLHDNFVHQWASELRHERRAVRNWAGRFIGRLLGGGPATPVAPMDRVPPGRGHVLVQFVRTEPRTRPTKQAIGDIYLRAIMNARKLVYIENQFFRSPAIAEALARVLQKHPRLQVIVVTNRVGPPLRYLNPPAHWTRVAQDMIRAVRPDFCLHELLACGQLAGATAYRPVWIHAKVMVIDDTWLTVGSANINERSISSEFEANVAIDDAPTALNTRRRLMAEHLGLDVGDPRLTDPLEAHALWQTLAAENAEARRRHLPARGRAHPFIQEGAWLRGRPEWF